MCPTADPITMSLPLCVNSQVGTPFIFFRIGFVSASASAIFLQMLAFQLLLIHVPLSVVFGWSYKNVCFCIYLYIAGR